MLFVIPLCLSALLIYGIPLHSQMSTLMKAHTCFVLLEDMTLLPQGAPFYDHPFFGQIFVASVMALFDYPDSMGISADADVTSVEKLFLFPRVLMGFLAVADTFLVYKIAERRYNRTVAFIAAILFAVMPITWILRRSKSKDTDHEKNKRTIDKRFFVTIMLSGIFLGLAIFTKIPAITFIPLISFLVFTNSGRNWRVLGLWFIPVILIPAMWPMSAYSVGQFEDWPSGN